MLLAVRLARYEQAEDASYSMVDNKGDTVSPPDPRQTDGTMQPIECDTVSRGANGHDDVPMYTQ